MSALTLLASAGDRAREDVESQRPPNSLKSLTEWPSNVQTPVLAYLLKVSPEEARPRAERAQLG